MIRTVGVETRRFWRRPAVLLLILATAALLLLAAGSLAYESRPLSEAERAAATEQYDAERGAAAEQLTACLADPEAFFGTPADETDCEQVQPQLEWYLPRQPLDLSAVALNEAPGMAVLVAALALLAGATFAGADWASGSLTTQLLVQPRRTRLWTAKALAVTGGVTAAAVGLLAAFWAVLAAVALARGLPVSADDAAAIAEVSGRTLALAAATGAGSYAVTMLLRRTGGTIGALFGFVVVSEILVAALPLDRPGRWSVPLNVAAWLQDGTEVFLAPDCPPGQDCPTFFVLTAGDAVAYLGALLLVALVASVLTFRRRDVR